MTTSAQESLVSRLKSLEENGVMAQDAKSLKRQKGKTVLISMDYGLIYSLDSLATWVLSRKQSEKASFEADIEPRLQDLIAAQNLSIDFSDQEALLLDSFLEELQWENIPTKVALYQEFMANESDPSAFRTFFAFLEWLRQAYNALESTRQEHVFRLYSPIDWLVFSKQPVELFYWEVALGIWHSPTQNSLSPKCIEKL